MINPSRFPCLFLLIQYFHWKKLFLLKLYHIVYRFVLLWFQSFIVHLVLPYIHIGLRGGQDNWRHLIPIGDHISIYEGVVDPSTKIKLGKMPIVMSTLLNKIKRILV